VCQGCSRHSVHTYTDTCMYPPPHMTCMYPPPQAAQDTRLRNLNTRCGRLHNSTTGPVSLDHVPKSILGHDAVRALRDSTDAGAAQSNNIHRGTPKKKTPARQRKTNQFHSCGQAKSRILELKPNPRSQNVNANAQHVTPKAQDRRG
jgi:hypothetical protein